jgi:hypothetical protein
MNRVHSSLIPLTHLHTRAICVARNSEKEEQCEPTEHTATSAAARFIWILNTDVGRPHRKKQFNLGCGPDGGEDKCGWKIETLYVCICYRPPRVGSLLYYPLTDWPRSSNYLNQSSDRYTYCRPFKHRAAVYPDSVWLSTQTAVISLNPLNAELNPICHLLILLDLKFMGPFIVSISNKMQLYTLYLY